MARKKKTRIDTSAETPSLGSLASALSQAGFTSPQPPTPSKAQKEAKGDEPPDGLRLKGKVVLRVQRKGRGGKTVTLVEGLSLTAASLSSLAKTLRQSLGCGVAVEGQVLVAQGDQADRLKPLLLERGAKKIVGP